MSGLLESPERNVVICSAQFWRSPIQISAHQLARQFVRHNWRVAFLGNPISPVHLLRRRDPIIAARFAEARRGGWDCEGRLFHWTPMTWLPLFAATARFRAMIDGWSRFAAPGFRKVLGDAGFSSVDVLILDSALHGRMLKTTPARRTVLRITDHNTGFASATQALFEAEKRIARQVDCVVVTAERLVPYAQEIGARRICHVGNGVDYQHFAAPMPIPVEYSEIPEPRAVFVGSLAEWFDFALMADVAKALPDVSFVLIGPDGMARRSLPKAPNLHVLGARPYQQVPAYLQHAHVGLIPFDVVGRAALVNAVNPIKLYEYFAAGLPVVASSWPELESINSPAYLCNGREEFAAAIRRAISGRAWKKSAGVDFALSHDWSRRYQELIEALDGNQS